MPVLEGTSYLRPLVFVSWFLEFRWAGGYDPFWSHAVNITIHCFNGLLVYFLARFFHPGRHLLMPLLAASVYLVHPSLVEAVAWVSGRFDLLCTTFMLLASVTYLSSPNGEAGAVRSLAIMLFFLGALFSKELGLVLPGVLVCLWFAVQGELKMTSAATWQRLWAQNKTLLSFLALGLATYSVVRASSPGGIYHQTLGWEYFKKVIWEDQLPLVALNRYMLSTMLPFFNIDPLDPPLNIDLRYYVINGLFLVGLVSYVVWGRRLSGKIYWLLAAWFCCIFPVLHFVPLSITGEAIQQRFLTAPVAFFAIAFSLLVSRLFFLATKEGRLAIKIVAPCYLLLCFFISKSVMPVWSSDEALWAWVYNKYPESELALNNYMFGLIKHNKFKKAVELGRRRISEAGALEADIQTLYGVALAKTGDREGVLYLQGVVDSLPKLHLQYPSKEAGPRISLSNVQIATAYMAYSHVLATYEKDLDGAVEYNDVAQWYLDEGSFNAIWFQRLAYGYLLGDAKMLNDAKKHLIGLRLVNEKAAKSQSMSIVVDYCKEVDAPVCNDAFSGFNKVLGNI